MSLLDDTAKRDLYTAAAFLALAIAVGLMRLSHTAAASADRLHRRALRDADAAAARLRQRVKELERTVEEPRRELDERQAADADEHTDVEPGAQP